MEGVKLVQSDDTASGSRLVPGGGQNLPSDITDSTGWVERWVGGGTEAKCCLMIFLFFFVTLDAEE